MTPPTSQRGALLAKFGAWLQLAQVLGFLGTAFAMKKSFDTLGTTGTSDPSKLSAAIGEALYCTAAGIVIAIIGIILITIAATVQRYRAQWFFWFLCIYGGVMTLSHMFPFGLCLLIYALMKRKEFDLDPPPAPGTTVQ